MGSSQKFGLQWRLRKSLMLQMKGKLTPYWKCQNSLTKLFYFFEAMNTCSFIRRFNFLMTFVGDKKRVESMLKDNATVFSNAENMLFGPKYEELVAKSLSSKTRSKELFGSIIYQELSKEESRRQPFCKGPLFRSRGNRGRGIFIPAGQTLQQQYPAGGQGRVRMNLLIGPSISSGDLLSASEFCKVHLLIANLFPVKVKQLPKADRVKHFVRNWQRLTNNLIYTGYSTRLRNPFYFSTKAIKATKSVSINQRIVRPSGSRSPGHVEEGCYSSFGSQRGPIFQLYVSCHKERWGELPISQPK